MKIAISLPDRLYERGERAAARLGRTRSALYAEALAAYLDTLDDEVDEVTARLDEVYAGQSDDDRTGPAAARRLIDAGAWQW